MELFGSTLNCTDGIFSFIEDIEADKQGLLKAILCFCRLYPIARQKVMEMLGYGFLALIIAWAVAIVVYNTMYTH